MVILYQTDIFWIKTTEKSSVIRQKGESQNGCSMKTKHVKFSEKRTFLTPDDAHVCALLYLQHGNTLLFNVSQRIDLLTLRDIRVTCVYKVFSRCLCKRLVSFLTNESLLEQIRSARFDLQLNDGDWWFQTYEYQNVCNIY